MIEYLFNAGATEWLVIAGAIIFIFDRIAKITPTETDDKILQVIRKIAKALSIQVPDVKRLNMEKTDVE